MDVTIVSTTTLVLNDAEVAVVARALRHGTEDKRFNVDQRKTALDMLAELDPEDF